MNDLTKVEAKQVEKQIKAAAAKMTRRLESQGKTQEYIAKALHIHFPSLHQEK